MGAEGFHGLSTIKRINLPIAKITRPKISGAIHRKRLFKLFDGSRKKPIVWISGPAGSGKTTLAASYLDARKLPCLWYQIDERDSDVATFFYYMGLAAKKAAPRKRAPLPLLTPEYLGGIPAFTKRYFEELYSRLNSSSPPLSKRRKGEIIVIDNYQDAPSDSMLHEVIAHGLDAVPPGVNIIVLSRNEPPSVFSRMCANGQMSMMGWEELRFTEQEAREVVRDRGQGRAADSAVKLLHEKTGGWVAGLVLMMESARTMDINEKTLKKIAPKEIFDYFATEIFDKIAGETQAFLLKTSFLTQMEPKVVERLTGISRAGRILSDLERNNFFTTKRHNENAYQYHSLFREFLLSRVEDSLSRAEISLLQRNSAQLLKEAGQVEDAAALFRDTHDWEGLVGLVLENALPMLTQGRGQTLEKWLVSIPEKIIENTPWLLYWMGVCRQPFDPSEAKTHFQKAFHSFKLQKDSAGTFLSWSGIVDTFLYEWDDFTPLDHWIEQFDGFMQGKPSFPSPEIEIRVASSMTAALMIRQPWRPDLSRWLERALSLARQTPDTNLLIQTLSYVVNYYGWIGDLSKVMVVMEEIRRTAHSSDASPLVKVTWLWLETALSIISGVSPDSAARQISEALDLARTTGVHIWDHMLFAMGVYASLIQNDLETAEHYLRKKEGSLRSAGDSSHYHYLSCWYHFLKEDVSRATADAEKALRLVEETGYIFPIIQCRLEMAHVLYEQGKDQEANAHIAYAYTLSKRTKSLQHQYACLLAKAHLAFDGGKEKAGLEFLGDALRIGRENGYFYLLWWSPPKVMTRLCAKALENGIEVSHVKDLIRKCRINPPAPPSGKEGTFIEHWPWPLKIYTLGRFELIKDGKPLTFSGKVQQKPLELLKALISFGGKEIAQERLIDSLWPESEGDAANNSFRMALSRLRRIVGINDAIKFQDGKATIDQRFVWVDAWAFEHVHDRLELAIKKIGDVDLMSLAENAVNLYRGHFLSDDEKYVWAVSCRERMKNRFLRLIGRIGVLLRQEGKYHEAVEYYNKALEIDDLIEEFYRGLMVCYRHLGRRQDAIAVYKRCGDTISRGLGAEISQETENFYKSLQ